MSGKALGVIEVVGMAAAMEAADSCVKSADVELIGYELTKGSGLVVIKIRGNVGAVQAALEAAKISAGRINKVYASLIIPRQADNLEKFIGNAVDSEVKSNKDKVENKTKGDIEDKTNNEIKKEVVESIEENIKKEKCEDIIKNEDIENVSEGIFEKEVKEDAHKYILKSDSNEDILQNNIAEEGISENTEKYSQEEIERNIDNNDKEPESEDICNICHDSKCPRRKGQAKNLCIHYKKS